MVGGDTGGDQVASTDGGLCHQVEPSTSLVIPRPGGRRAGRPTRGCVSIQNRPLDHRLDDLRGDGVGVDTDSVEVGCPIDAETRTDARLLQHPPKPGGLRSAPTICRSDRTGADDRDAN